MDSKAVEEKEVEVKRLNMLVKQRDNEISILLNYLNKKKNGEPVGAEPSFEPGIPVQRSQENSM
jgi:hypothetical protein